MSLLINATRYRTASSSPLSINVKRAARRCIHRKTGRQVTVQLVANVPGLGPKGSVKEVAPGHMRNLLKPKKWAVYVKRGAEPEILIPEHINTASNGQSNSPPARLPTTDFGDLQSRLASLPPLTFARRLLGETPDLFPFPGATTPLPGRTSKPLIHGSVTTVDVMKLLESEHSLSLVAPDAVLSFGAGVDRLKQLGKNTVEVHLRNGEVIPIRINVIAEA